jgi:hypothetical protein
LAEIYRFWKRIFRRRVFQISLPEAESRRSFEIYFHRCGAEIFGLDSEISRNRRMTAYHHPCENYFCYG